MWVLTVNLDGQARELRLCSVSDQEPLLMFEQRCDLVYEEH